MLLATEVFKDFKVLHVFCPMYIRDLFEEKDTIIIKFNCISKAIDMILTITMWRL